MNDSVTIRDVAAAAGVSRQTVSRALNNKGEISEETRQKVMEIAGQLGYRPSIVARGLSTNRTYTIGLLVPDVRHDLFARLVHSAEHHAARHGYNLFLRNTHRDSDDERGALESLWDHRVDGAILYSSFLPPEQIREYAARFQHLVLINTNQINSGDPHLAVINVDDPQGAYLAARHLIEHGHQHIGFVGYSEPSTSGFKRVIGYQQALDEFGLSGSEQVWRIPYEHDPEQIEALCAQITTQSPVSAVLAHNDLLAIELIQTLRSMGKRVPEDVAVVGFDDIRVASIVSPTLTTVAIDAEHLGSLAIDTLLGMIEGNPPAQAHQLLIPQLIIRESA
ncbi:MAG: LacI family DNA-binding transcriptional regulator [Anaerolineaceae bacterium]|nr:LacI family DNA-binding transcriptional regulator [Anaerolineaceae bacterium]